MTYQQFVVEIRNRVAELMGENFRIEIHTALKNNDQEYVGLLISNNISNISPTIYLEEYYQRFLNETSLSWIAEDICELYYEVEKEQGSQLGDLHNFLQMKSKIAFKLINRSQNQRYLNTHPHKIYYDHLAMVFYILFESDLTGMASIPINYELMNFWQETEDSLEELALINTPKLLPFTLKPMRTVIWELLGKPDMNHVPESDMYILTNTFCTFGAGCLLYKDILSHIGNVLQESFYIIPSSVHELILAPCSYSPNHAELNRMITDINHTQVKPEEVLDYQAYFYDIDKHQFFY